MQCWISREVVEGTRGALRAADGYQSRADQ